MPKYQVTGWVPTAMYAMVEVEAPNAQAAVEIGRETLLEVGEFEYVDDNPVGSNGLDEIRAESDEASDSHTWTETQQPHADSADRPKAVVVVEIDGGNFRQVYGDPSIEVYVVAFDNGCEEEPGVCRVGGSPCSISLERPTAWPDRTQEVAREHADADWLYDISK